MFVYTLSHFVAFCRISVVLCRIGYAACCLSAGYTFEEASYALYQPY